MLRPWPARCFDFAVSKGSDGQIVSGEHGPARADADLAPTCLTGTRTNVTTVGRPGPRARERPLTRRSVVSAETGTLRPQGQSACAPGACRPSMQQTECPAPVTSPCRCTAHRARPAKAPDGRVTALLAGGHHRFALWAAGLDDRPRLYGKTSVSRTNLTRTTITGDMLALPNRPHCCSAGGGGTFVSPPSLTPC